MGSGMNWMQACIQNSILSLMYYTSFSEIGGFCIKNKDWKIIHNQNSLHYAWNIPFSRVQTVENGA